MANLTEEQRQTVYKALKTPYKPLLDFAMTYVSLNEKQRSALFSCVIQGHTEEEVAELLDRSRDAIARWKSAAMERCFLAWKQCPELIEQMCEY